MLLNNIKNNPRHDEDLREPLVRRQGSQVSMRVARGSASWLSSHGRGLGPRDARGPDPSSKATLWVKAQHVAALSPPCIVRKDPRVPHECFLSLTSLPHKFQQNELVESEPQSRRA